jgi:hypothetical protein
MCPANSWHHAKDLLNAVVKILIGFLRYMKLSIKEYRYIVLLCTTPFREGGAYGLSFRTCVGWQGEGLPPLCAQSL